VDGVNKEGEESGSEGALGCTQAHPNQQCNVLEILVNKEGEESGTHTLEQSHIHAGQSFGST
jgi:hypothetical protein